jgi:hypothetical protein
MAAAASVPGLSTAAMFVAGMALSAHSAACPESGTR